MLLNLRREYSGRLISRRTPARQGTVLRLASYSNMIIRRATGMRKTYLSYALGDAESGSMHKIFGLKYVLLPDLPVELALTRGNGTYRDVMKNYRKPKVLILDMWLLLPTIGGQSQRSSLRSSMSGTSWSRLPSIPRWTSTAGMSISTT